MKGKRLAAHFIDGTLVLFGVVGLLAELSKGRPSSTNFYMYVLAGLLLTCGVIIFIGIRSTYGGGAWSLFGLLLVAAALARITAFVQAYMQGREVRSVAFYSSIAALWGVGCYCLAWGHVRCHRKTTQPQYGADPSQPL